MNIFSIEEVRYQYDSGFPGIQIVLRYEAAVDAKLSNVCSFCREPKKILLINSQGYGSTETEAMRMAFQRLLDRDCQVKPVFIQSKCECWQREEKEETRFDWKYWDKRWRELFDQLFSTKEWHIQKMLE